MAGLNPFPRRLMRTLIAASLGLLLTSCGGGDLRGSGQVITEVIAVGDFTAIGVSDSFQVDVEVGGNAFVEVRVDDNLIDELDISVDGGVLNVGLRDDVSVRDATLEAVVRVPELTEATASGGSSVAVAGTFGPQQGYSASGGSDMRVAGTAGALNVTASGGSTIALEGSAQRLTLSAGGGSTVDVEVGDIAAAVVDISGGSDVDLQTAAVVAGTLSGGSDLTVPSVATVDVEVTGGSEVRRR